MSSTNPPTEDPSTTSDSPPDSESKFLPNKMDPNNTTKSNMSYATMITPMTSKPDSKQVNITSSTTDSPSDIPSSDATRHHTNVTLNTTQDNVDPSHSKTDIDTSSPSDKDTSKTSSESIFSADFSMFQSHFLNMMTAMERRINVTFDNQSIAFKNEFISKADLSQSISTSNATLMSNINNKFEKFKQHQQETACHIKHATAHFSVLDNQHKQLKEKLHIHREDINRLSTSMATLNTSFTSKQQKLEEEIEKAISFASTTPTNLSADLESEILDDITDLKTITNTIKADVDELKITMTPFSKTSQTHSNSLFPSSPQVSTPSTANLDIINHQEMKIKDQADAIKALTEQMQLHQHTIDLCYQRIGQQKNIDPTIANPNAITEKYPILKPTKMKSHQSIFQAQLEHIHLQDDTLLAVEQFWNNIGNAYATTFGTSTSFPKYRSLKHSSKATVFDFMLPPRGHPHIQQANATFEQLATALHNHLIKDKTITADTSPKAHMILSINKYQLDGFDLLTHITYDLSPQLGGKGGQDAQAMVDTFNFGYTETLYDFHSRSLKFLDELHILIKLRNTMDQINKFKYKYITHLHNQNNISIKSIMARHIIHVNQFKQHQLLWDSKQFSTSINEIYEELTLSGIPCTTMILPSDEPSSTLATPSVALSMLPPAQVNQFKSPYKRHSNHRQSSRQHFNKPTYKTDFAGCSGCQTDAEAQLNIIKQVITHDKDSCLLLSNSNIKDKSTREAVKQHNAKHPHQNRQRHSTDIPRKSPRLAIIPSPNANTIDISPSEHPASTDQSNAEDQFTSQDPDDDPSTSEDEPTDKDETNDDTEEFHMQPYGMQSNLPFPIIESMNQFDTLQA